MAISSAVSQSNRARTVGIEARFQNLRAGQLVLLPQRVAIIGQGATASTYDTTKRQVSSAAEVGQLYGFGSPVHLAALQLLPENGDGIGAIPLTIYPLEDDGSGVAAAGDITPSGTATAAGTLRVLVNNIVSEAISVAIGDTVADLTAAIKTAVDAVIDMPVTTVDNTIDVALTAKWKGASGNGLVIAIDGDVSGLTFAITQPTSGATNPDVDTALNQIGDVWETMIVNCMDLSDTATLTKYQTWGDGRWNSLVAKPAVVFTGLTEADLATAIAVPDARLTDRVNSALVAPGSDDLPFVVAARQVARIAVVANENPPRDYGSQDATGLTPGTDAEQWTYTQRDQAIKAGTSSIKVKDGVINLADTVTFYHPAGETDPAFRYVVDIVKLMNVLYNIDLIFNTAEWDGAPLIPDGQTISNRSAKQPKMAVAAMATMIDNLALEAIISDPDAAKATIQAGINSQNPKRLDVAMTVQISGNTNIISVDLNWGFYFGTTPPVV